jgi:hypothetical protein
MAGEQNFERQSFYTGNGLGTIWQILVGWPADREGADIAVDTNGDGHDEIVHSNSRGQLLVRNGNGDILARYLPDFYVSNFALTRWGGETRATHILVPVSEVQDGCCKSKIVLLDAHGEKLTERDDPLGGLFSRFSATPVRFREGAEYYAVLEDNSPEERSMLVLYAQDGQIAYQEILGESCLGTTAYSRKKYCEAVGWVR